MKATVLVLLIMIAGVLAGCNGTNPAEPVTSHSNTFTTVTPAIAKPGNSIALAAVLREPSAANQTVAIYGLVKYSIIVGDEIAYPDRYTVEVRFTTDATLTASQGETKSLPPVSTEKVSVWNVCCSSVDRLVVAKRGNSLLTKSYPVAGRADGLRLNMQFTVSHTAVTLGHMWFSVARTSVDPPQN